MTYHTEKIETAIAKIHECLDAPIDPVRVRRLLKDIGKWSAEAEREAYARGKADAAPQASAEARNAALEEAAQKCIDRSERVDDNAAHSACLRCARDIRALKSAPAAEASAKGAGDVDECNFSDLIDAYTDAVRNGNFSERVAARAELMNSYRQQRGGDASERIALKAIAEYPTPGDGSMSAANMREIARKALMAVPLPSSPPSISYRKIESGGGDTDAAVAAIRFALEADDGMAWLRCWNEGDFDACRNEWPETPEECFIGADPLHPSTRASLAARKPDDEPLPRYIERIQSNIRESKRKDGFVAVRRYDLDRVVNAAIAQQRKGEGGE